MQGQSMRALRMLTDRALSCRSSLALHAGYDGAQSWSVYAMRRAARHLQLPLPTARGTQRQCLGLFLEHPLDLADLALHFAADFVRRPAVLKIDISCRPAGFLFQLALGFFHSAFGAIFRACSHTRMVRAPPLVQPW